MIDALLGNITPTTVFWIALLILTIHGDSWYVKYTKSRYQDETEDRFAIIKRRRKVDHNWKEIANAINNASFRNERGKRFSAKEIRNEYIEMLEQEEAEQERVYPKLLSTKWR